MNADGRRAEDVMMMNFGRGLCNPNGDWDWKVMVRTFLPVLLVVSGIAAAFLNHGFRIESNETEIGKCMDEVDDLSTEIRTDIGQIRESMHSMESQIKDSMHSMQVQQAVMVEKIERVLDERDRG